MSLRSGLVCCIPTYGLPRPSRATQLVVEAVTTVLTASGAALVAMRKVKIQPLQTSALWGRGRTSHGGNSRYGMAVVWAMMTRSFPTVFPLFPDRHSPRRWYNVVNVSWWTSALAPWRDHRAWSVATGYHCCVDLAPLESMALPAHQAPGRRRQQRLLNPRARGHRVGYLMVRRYGSLLLPRPHLVGVIFHARPKAPGGGFGGLGMSVACCPVHVSGTEWVEEHLDLPAPRDRHRAAAGTGHGRRAVLMVPATRTPTSICAARKPEGTERTFLTSAWSRGARSNLMILRHYHSPAKAPRGDEQEQKAPPLGLMREPLTLQGRH